MQEKNKTVNMNTSEIWVQFSGGKDSIFLSLKLIDEGIEVTGFVCALVWHGEESDIINNIKKFKKYAESKGYKFELLINYNPIEPFMKEVITQKNSPYYNKVRGFPMMVNPCWISRDWKIKLLTRFEKQREVITGNPIIKYIGYTIDEPSSKRKKRIKEYQTGKDFGNIRYPLVDWNITEEDCREGIKQCGWAVQSHLDYPRTGCWYCHKAPKKSRLKAICKYQWRLDKIKEWTKSTGRELYIDITLAEIEAHFKEKHKEVAGCKAESDNGISPTNKLVGILPKIL